MTVTIIDNKTNREIAIPNVPANANVEVLAQHIAHANGIVDYTVIQGD